MARRDECFQIGSATTPEEVLANHVAETESTPRTPGPPTDGAARRAEYWKAELLAANAEIDRLTALLGAAPAEREGRELMAWMVEALDGEGRVLDLAHFPRFYPAADGPPHHGRGFRVTAVYAGAQERERVLERALVWIERAPDAVSARHLRDRARRALAAAPREQEPDTRPVFNDGKCPKCGSIDTRARANLLTKDLWHSRCEDCDHRWDWTEADVAEPPAPGETREQGMAGAMGRGVHGYLAGEARCMVPPEGWLCTREADHEGPCAAVSEISAAGERILAAAEEFGLAEWVLMYDDAIRAGEDHDAVYHDMVRAARLLRGERAQSGEDG